MSTAVPGLARAFVAVVPPPDVLDAVERALAPVRAEAPPQLVWSRRAQWHLTLQFLGRVDDVETLVGAIDAGLAAARPVMLRLGTAGAFPSAVRASVLWLGVDEGAEDLAALAGVVRAATAALGHEAEARPFSAHLTVARARRPRAVGAVLGAFGDGPFGPAWDVREVLLMDSDTRRDGAVHREIARITLGG